MDEENWDDQGPTQELGRMVKAEKCSPDYEGMIRGVEESTAVAQRLFSAVEDTILTPIGIGISSRKLTGLLGTLYVKIKRYELTREQIIRNQEADPTP